MMAKIFWFLHLFSNLLLLVLNQKHTVATKNFISNSKTCQLLIGKIRQFFLFVVNVNNEEILSQSRF